MTQEILDISPRMPLTIEETGLSSKFTSSLLFKCLYRLGLETNLDIATCLKLGQGIVDDLLGKLKQQGFVEMRAVSGGDSRISRYSLTNAGKDLAIEASRQSEYVGPAPVPLVQYRNQVQRQQLGNETISPEDIAASLAKLVLPPGILRKLGPAISSGRSMLIYGPPGNGKTSISEAIGGVYRQEVYIPHCIEVDGQVIRVFDPTVHVPIQPEKTAGADGLALLKKRPDPRWVRCRRPVVVTGGELTLKMLDLDYDETARFYEAPPQVKATNGVFIIDDFGRQLVQPKDLLNRWIIPLEKRIDYLTIHTGKKFDVPFDELVIFSTNLPPEKLMDPGLMRRVKYKLRVDPPSLPEYVAIFRQVCCKYRLELPEELLSYLLHDYYPKKRARLAAFHPSFIVEHAMSACQYFGKKPELSIELAQDALENLFISETEEEGARGTEGAVPSDLSLSEAQRATAALSGIAGVTREF